MKSPVSLSICLFLILALIIVSQQQQIQHEEQRREEKSINGNVDTFDNKIAKRKRSLSAASKPMLDKPAFLNRRLHKREADPMEEQSCVVRVQKVC